MMRGPAIRDRRHREGKVSRSTFASIAALISLVNAVPALIAPAAIASLYGVSVDAQTLLIAQLLAAAYLGYAVIAWTTRDTTETAVRRGIDAGNALPWGVSAVIWIYVASTGMTNAVGWFAAGLTVVFALGWAYFLIVDRSSESGVVAITPRV